MTYWDEPTPEEMREQARRNGEWRRCPCGAPIFVGTFAETLICRACGAWLHPEQTRPR